MKEIRTKNGIEKFTDEQVAEMETQKEADRVANLTYQEKRLLEYGSLLDQMEFITENGLEAWQEKVAEIKIRITKE